jgi:hypothetical protein
MTLRELITKVSLGLANGENVDLDTDVQDYLDRVREDDQDESRD